MGAARVAESRSLRRREPVEKCGDPFVAADFAGHEGFAQRHQARGGGPGGPTQCEQCGVQHSPARDDGGPGGYERPDPGEQAAPGGQPVTGPTALRPAPPGIEKLVGSRDGGRSGLWHRRARTLQRDLGYQARVIGVVARLPVD